ncbi:uncharacterized protein LOC129941046 [Eupeodes corollae]|uniref:uncharacterized protein LOC129941046 n=1 Tax=Eupeodes corollae TaxID=290404 RepID=UPI0024905E55|nr:uncharacterized protein LOC129941046 [Eupeodes corollae]
MSKTFYETPRETKIKFLRSNPKYSEIEDDNEALGDFFKINEEDEVWLVQCPKGTDISILKDQKIKLPGRSNQDEYETVATEFPEPIPHAFGHKNKKAHNSLKIVPIQGNIVIRSRLKILTPPDASLSEGSSTVKVPMPKGIKQRHPLHGVDFESKLTICPEIAERLKQAHAVSEVPNGKHKSKNSKHKSNESNTVAMDSDGEVELVLQKKHKLKKKKRKHSSGDEDVEVAPKKKKKSKKNSQSEDVAEDLEWLKRL